MLAVPVVEVVPDEFESRARTCGTDAALLREGPRVIFDRLAGAADCESSGSTFSAGSALAAGVTLNGATVVVANEATDNSVIHAR
jgi:hypothetical protein